MKRAQRVVRIATVIGLCIGVAAAGLSACSGSSFQGGSSGGAAGVGGAGKGGSQNQGGASGKGSAGSGGTSNSGGASTGGSGGGGEPCGSKICSAGEYCCNASCSVCAPENAGCPAIACLDAGGPPVTCGGMVCAPGQSCCGSEACGQCIDATELCALPADCSDSGPPGGGDRCGRVRCGEGLECCNPTCNACVPPDTGCTEEACPPDCSAMAATGQGACTVILGVAWNGQSCVYVSGCDCEGADCANLFSSIEECEPVFGGCG